MATLFNIFEEMSGNSHEDESLYRLINKGLEIRPDRRDGNTFWDDFLSVLTSNPEETSKLLDIKRETISKWTPKIKKLVEEVNKQTKEKSKKNRMIWTGA